MGTENDSKDPGISDLRSVIDAIDSQLLDLINRRLATAKKIGQIKSMQQLQVQDRTRERQVLNRLDRQNRGPLKADDLHHLFMEIISITREIQGSGTIAFLGPEATLTHYAALQHFGHNAPLKPLPSLQDVFRDVERGSSRYGVVPVGNAVEGALTHALELFYDSDLTICGERFLSATLDLLAKEGTPGDVTHVFAHPHFAAQCRGWLRKHLPDADIRECHSTAEAAAMASHQRGAAAVGTSAAAHIFGLKTLVSSIEDRHLHLTRFLIVGRDERQPTGSDKTSLLFVTPNVPGALYRLLKPLDAEGVNMVKLESLPVQQESWSYRFFADLEGHRTDEPIRKAVERMQPLCLHLRILGSYPAAPFEGGDRERP